MFRRQQQIRYWALRALLVWLFGIGLGVANACLASEFAADGNAFQGNAGVQSANLSAVSDGCEQHSGPNQSRQDHSSKSSCESFCERAGVTIPPQKSSFDTYQFHVVPLPTVATLTFPKSIDVSVDIGAPRRDGARPLSIPIAFLRLTL